MPPNLRTHPLIQNKPQNKSQNKGKKTKHTHEAESEHESELASHNLFCSKSMPTGPDLSDAKEGLSTTVRAVPHLSSTRYNITVSKNTEQSDCELSEIKHQSNTEEPASMVSPMKV